MYVVCVYACCVCVCVCVCVVCVCVCVCVHSQWLLQWAQTSSSPLVLPSSTHTFVYPSLLPDMPLLPPEGGGRVGSGKECRHGESEMIAGIVRSH